MGVTWNSTLHRDPAKQLRAKPGKRLKRGRIRPVSLKRQWENRERQAMADRRWPDRRDGTVMCGVPCCPQRASDLHEPKFRSRLGSITDPENAIPVCREHHDWIHAHPLEAHELGLAVNSWE